MKIRASYETEIGPTQAGYIKIEQPDSMGDEPQSILLSADQLPKVIAELRALYKDRAAWDFDEADHDGRAGGPRGEEPSPLVVRESTETH